MSEIVVSDGGDKRGPGRPTRYDPSYCDLVIEDAKLGFSLSAFAGGILVSRQTITDWRKAHPEFDAACATAKVVRARFLEGGMMERDIPAPAMNARKFALVNCAEEDWRAETTLKHVGGDPASGDQPIRHALDISSLTPEQQAALAGVKLEGE